MDGLEPLKSLSPTLSWVPDDDGTAAKDYRSPEVVLRDVKPDVQAVLRSLLGTEHGLYSSSGEVLKAYPFIVQIQGSEDQPPDAVHGAPWVPGFLSSLLPNCPCWPLPHHLSQMWFLCSRGSFFLSPLLQDMCNPRSTSL